MSTAARARGNPAALDVEGLRRDFPILSRRIHGKPLVYLDNAATTQKPITVIQTETRVYEEYYANVHRGVHLLSVASTEEYEKVREKIRALIGAAETREIVFVRGTTEGINLVAQTYGRQHVGAGDEVLITHLEHHSNIVPWQMLCEEKGAKLVVAPIDARGQVVLAEYERLLSNRTKIVSFAHVSNALGTLNPVARMTALAHAKGAVVLVDGAQAVPRLPVDVAAVGCDFYAFSGHKMYGPTGIGVLWGKAALLEAMPPWQGGGDMISSVTFAKTTWNVLPYKFEAGTPNIAGRDRPRRRRRLHPRGRLAAHRRARGRPAGVRHRASRPDPPGPSRRHGRGKSRRPLLHDRGRAPARHRHGAGSGRNRGPHRTPLRAAGHGFLPGPGDRQGLLRPLQHARRSRRARGRRRRRRPDVPLR